MAYGKVKSMPLDWRLTLADCLVDGGSNDDARGVLRGAGARQEDLPNDDCLTTYRKDDEFIEHEAARKARWRRENWGPEAVDPTVDWQTAGVTRSMAQIVYRLEEGTLNVDQEVRLIRAMTLLQTLDFRREVWRAERQDLLERRARHAEARQAEAAEARVSKIAREARRQVDAGAGQRKAATAAPSGDFLPNLPAGMSMLEACCALDRMAELLAKEPAKAAALGLTTERLAHLREHVAIPSTNAAAQALKLALADGRVSSEDLVWHMTTTMPMQTRFETLLAMIDAADAADEDADDADDAVAMDVADEVAEPAGPATAETLVPSLAPDNSGEIRESPGISGDVGESPGKAAPAPAFRNSPSRAKREAARQKRKKR